MTRANIKKRWIERVYLNKHDSNYAQIAAIGRTLRYCRQNYPRAHLIFQDLDILPLSSTWIPKVFAKQFTMAIVNRPPTIYASLNCGLLLFHRAYLSLAASFFDLALDLYRRKNYFSLHRLIKGHSCCAQHVIQVDTN